MPRILRMREQFTQPDLRETIRGIVCRVGTTLGSSSSKPTVMTNKALVSWAIHQWQVKRVKYWVIDA